MSAQAVLELLDVIIEAGADPWVDGGWGIDALLEEQTRAHRDLDIVIACEVVAHVRAILEHAGFIVIRVWLPAHSWRCRSGTTW
jgi:lincosamide nucleotidyltransferase A/C/D/E